MDFGVHLPQIGWDDEPFSRERLTSVAATADRLGYTTISANDHLVYGLPWLDGPIALAAASAAAPNVRLMTTVSLPVVRGPFALAKALAALDVVSGGRVEAGVGPGSSAADFALGGIPFDERWSRFEESIHVLRASWGPSGSPFVGRFYDTTSAALAPPPAQPNGPPIWIGSWGSVAGLRRVARLADGWLASGYNTTPEAFSAALGLLGELLEAEGREPAAFPTTMATTWLRVTDDHAEVRAVVERMSAMLRRSTDEIADRLPIGSVERIVDLFGRYEAAGLQRLLLWPIGNEVEQIERVAADVLPQIRSS
jgi:alkanesulfonate monooxygenase SsuD/methylene tetrahydromethanopterin reductase-like flavin-dependent oxidoreductase (luciferase family)